MRYLDTCPGCSRQYDVTHLEQGTRVLCECGQHFAARHHQPHDPRVLRCGACGGNLRDAARKCDYCQAEITLDERRLDSVCPGCFARAASAARFCMECGVEFRPQQVAALPAGTSCPRCQGGLKTRLLGQSSVIECSACAGLWLASDDFERVCSDADEQERAVRALGNAATPSHVVAELPLRYLPCPMCQQLMHRKNYASCSGIILDVCKQHGVWLDHRELERVLAFIKHGGLDKARSRELEELERKRTQVAREERAGRALDLGPLPPIAPLSGDWDGWGGSRGGLGSLGRFGNGGRGSLGTWLVLRVLKGLF